MAAGEKQKHSMPPQISTSSGRLVTPFWKEKYERDARRYWDIFYKRHEDKVRGNRKQIVLRALWLMQSKKCVDTVLKKIIHGFFKDRHYLDKEWGNYFEGQHGEKMVILEVGCGAGNTIFPLLSTYPDTFVHACDFSPRAVDLVKKHKDFPPDRLNAFVCDITSDQLSENVQPSSVDIVTMIFVLSAVGPDKMPLVLQNVRNVLKRGGRVLFRDYAFGDLAQERLMSKGQQISENFFVRGDGTRAYYFSNKYLVDLFSECGFTMEEIFVHNKQVENRSLDLVMNRNWIQATFILNSAGLQNPNVQHDPHACEGKEDGITAKSLQKKSSSGGIDLSEDLENMFITSDNLDEKQIITIKAKGHHFKIKMLTKEYQHTCKSTGLMLWESAQFMCSILAENPSIVAGKRVLELGCGSAGICSMVAASFAQVVVATDGDAESLDLLRHNTASNLEPELLNKVLIRKLFWGNRDEITAVGELSCNGGGFDCIIGTDVAYNPDAILPLLKTARELISDKNNEDSESALILCYIQRRVHEDTIISTAIAHGFRLVDKWINGVHESNGIINSWLCGNDVCSAFRNATLSILYFDVCAINV